MISINTKIQHLDLIDLISERYRSLQKTIEKSWNEESAINITFSEWTVLSKLYKNQPKISEIAKSINISRQATHKIIKQLETKELIRVMNVTHNKKEKYLQLTSLGDDCIKKGEELMAAIENQISQAIGENEFAQLKDLLKLNWELKTE